MTQRQQDMLINIGIEVGITLASVGIMRLNQYLRETSPEASGIASTMRDIIQGARAFLDPTAIDIEDMPRR